MATFVAGCPKPPAPPPVTPTPDAADAAAANCPAGTAPDVCAYCTRMRVLHCAEGDPTPNGASCEKVTANVQSLPYAAMDLGCRTSKTSCADANRNCK